VVYNLHMRHAGSVCRSNPRSAGQLHSASPLPHRNRQELTLSRPGVRIVPCVRPFRFLLGNGASKPADCVDVVPVLLLLYVADVLPFLSMRLALVKKRLPQNLLRRKLILEVLRCPLEQNPQNDDAQKDERPALCHHAYKDDKLTVH
jgi:hypothetical protein